MVNVLDHSSNPNHMMSVDDVLMMDLVHVTYDTDMVTVVLDPAAEDMRHQINLVMMTLNLWTDD